MKFTPAAKEMFDKVYNQSINSQIKIKHPDTPVIDKEYWQTVCFNFATLAANAYEGFTLVVDGKDLNK